MKFLGIDTSCYTTSAAIVDENENVLKNVKVILTVKDGERGIRQSDAVFLHIKNMPGVFFSIGALNDLHAVSSSEAPRPVEGSYMPVFKVSESYAKVIAGLNGIKYYPSTHQHGHLYSAMIGNGVLNGEYLCCHISGGTTEVFKAGILNGIVNEIVHIGGTKDITCGQLIDRAGVLLKLPFPCGGHMEKLLPKGNMPASVKPLPITVDGVAANLSGAETYVINYIKQGIKKDILSKLVFDCCAKTICRLISNASIETGIADVILFGGVCSSDYIKDTIKKDLDQTNINTIFANKEYSADNAAGLALMAKRLYFKEKQ
ncbi:MAG: O-sialoglycoprotein endopeptidase [Eubacteriales bacterium]